MHIQVRTSGVIGQQLTTTPPDCQTHTGEPQGRSRGALTGELLRMDLLEHSQLLLYRNLVGCLFHHTSAPNCRIHRLPHDGCYLSGQALQ